MQHYPLLALKIHFDYKPQRLIGLHTVPQEDSLPHHTRHRHLQHKKMMKTL